VGFFYGAEVAFAWKDGETVRTSGLAKATKIVKTINRLPNGYGNVRAIK
jgi:hypothetical protein